MCRNSTVRSSPGPMKNSDAPPVTATKAAASQTASFPLASATISHTGNASRPETR